VLLLRQQTCDLIALCGTFVRADYICVDFAASWFVSTAACHARGLTVTHSRIQHRSGARRRALAHSAPLGGLRHRALAVIDYVYINPDCADHTDIVRKAKCFSIKNIVLFFYFHHTRFSGAALCELTLHRASTMRFVPHRLYLRRAASSVIIHARGLRLKNVHLPTLGGL
jgi:hypothetical protein